jgi:hypothetical protein
MGHIKEPVGVDLNLGPMTLSEDDRQALSIVIAQYKLTRKVPKSKPKLAKASGSRKATAFRTKNRKSTAKKAVSRASK